MSDSIAKMWIVEAGEYDERRTLAVFSTEASAEAYAAAYNAEMGLSPGWGGEAFVSPIDLDPSPPPAGMRGYRVHVPTNGSATARAEHVVVPSVDSLWWGHSVTLRAPNATVAIEAARVVVSARGSA